MIFKMNKKAITLIEIVVSTVILALVMLGLSNLFVAGRRYIVHSRARMTGGELGKLFLDYLQMSVREDTWAVAGNALQQGTRACAAQPNCPAPAERTLNGIAYDAQYTINGDNPINNINRVRVDITWREPTP